MQWKHKQQPGQRCSACSPKSPSSLVVEPPVGAVLIVHDVQQLLLIVGVDWTDGDVSDSPELATIVQVLILQSKKVPHKPPANTPEKFQISNKYPSYRLNQTRNFYTECVQYRFHALILRISCQEYHEHPKQLRVDCYVLQEGCNYFKSDTIKYQLAQS